MREPQVTQMQMWQRAEKRSMERIYAVKEIMESGNPMTQAEIASFVERHPDWEIAFRPYRDPV